RAAAGICRARRERGAVVGRQGRRQFSKRLCGTRSGRRSYMFPADGAKYSHGAKVPGVLPVPPSSPDNSAIKAYWQAGCTSCLRMKEFLTKQGVPFVSINVLEDKAALAELETLGIRSVPIVRRGDDWANGQVLRDVARVAGIAWCGAQVLPASELASRLVEIQ